MFDRVKNGRMGARKRWKEAPSAEERFWARIYIKSPDECWVWKLSKKKNGYGHCKYRGKYEGPHRVAYRLANGKIPKGKEVMHKCDNPPCCNPNHLKLGTHSENIRDCLEKGRGNRVKHFGKLRPHHAVEIKKLYENGLTQSEIGAIYKVNQSMISLIVTGKWIQAK